MTRYILTILLILSGYGLTAQVYNPIPQYVFRNKLGVGRATPVDTSAYMNIGPNGGANAGVLLPRVADTLSISGTKRHGLLIFSNQLSSFAYWDSVGAVWTVVGTGATGGGGGDVATLLNGSSSVGDSLLIPSTTGDSIYVKNIFAGNGFVMQKLGDTVLKINVDSSKIAYTKSANDWDAYSYFEYGTPSASAGFKIADAYDVTSVSNKRFVRGIRGDAGDSVMKIMGGRQLQLTSTDNDAQATRYYYDSLMIPIVPSNFDTVLYWSPSDRRVKRKLVETLKNTDITLNQNTIRKIRLGANSEIQIVDSATGSTIYAALSNGGVESTGIVTQNLSVTTTNIQSISSIGTTSANRAQIYYRNSDERLILKDDAQVLNEFVYSHVKATSSLDFTSTSAQSSQDLTITATNAAVGDIVLLGINGTVPANTSFSAWVSATNTVTVRFNNYSSGSVDPAAITFNVRVVKY